MSTVQRETADDESASRATLAEVAVRAGVSISTVSKVLNGRAGVSVDTRSRVSDLLREHRYNRRKSSHPGTPLIEVVFDRIETPWAFEVLMGVEKIARENGLSLVVTGTEERPANGPKWIESVLSRQPAGVILMISDITSLDKEHLRARSIPFVIVDPAGDPAPDVPSIGAANWMGGFLATQHLIELGHTAIAAVGGPTRMMAAMARLSGYRAALAGAGLTEHAGYARPGDFSQESGFTAGLELLHRDDRPTGVFTSNDLQALGVYEAAASLGFRVPDDLSVVGFDDLAMAKWTGPPLTTIRQPLNEMAQEAARLVLRLVDEPQLASTRLELATRLVVRKSTAPPPTV
jgi:LacI family xylobiose transport system transcriptional regulator